MSDCGTAAALLKHTEYGTLKWLEMMRVKSPFSYVDVLAVAPGLRAAEIQSNPPDAPRAISKISYEWREAVIHQMLSAQTCRVALKRQNVRLSQSEKKD